MNLQCCSSHHLHKNTQHQHQKQEKLTLICLFLRERHLSLVQFHLELLISYVSLTAIELSTFEPMSFSWVNDSLPGYFSQPSQVEENSISKDDQRVYDFSQLSFKRTQQLDHLWNNSNSIAIQVAL
jgi:hypothetical protein